MTNIDRQFLVAVRNEISKALAPIAEKHGITITTGRATYDGSGSNGSMKIDFARINDDGVVETREVADLRAYALIYQYDADAALTGVVTWANESYTVVGLRPSSKRWPVIGARLRDGKRFKLPLDVLTSKFPIASTVTDRREGKR